MSAALPPLVIDGAMLTDTGLVRRNNEDSLAYLPPAEIQPNRAIPLPGLAVIADGMGGHAAGEVASDLAVSTIVRLFHAGQNPIPARFAAAFAAANQAILRTAAEHPATAGMGTTCTALAFEAAPAGDTLHLWLAHIGDSRAYLHRGGALRQISEDHSLVAAMVREGRLTEAEAFTSPQRNIILRALGLDQDIEPQIWSSPLTLRAGDTLLLCSDGLSDLLPPARIATLLGAAPGPPPAAQDTCAALVAAALAAGGSDNITVGVFRVTGQFIPEP